MIQCIFISLFFMSSSLCAISFISGEAFKSIATFIYKEENDNCRCYLTHPELVQCGDIIFLSRTFLEDFFIKCHPKIKHPYILISHHNDMGITEDLRPYLDDKKLFALFAQNIEMHHPKLIPIPIGLRSFYINSDFAQEQHEALKKLSVTKHPKTMLLYANFCVTTNHIVRKPIFDYFKTCSFCSLCEIRKPVEGYLFDVASSQFIVSPRGSGIDCYRTWEALYLGSYPVVISSALDPLYEGLPVLIIKDWTDLSKELLEQKFIEFQHTQWNFEKLDFAYWHNLIKEAQITCRKMNSFLCS